MNNQLVAVPFRNQLIPAIMHDGVVYVSMRPVSENIGLEWSGQQKKLVRTQAKFNCVHINTVAADGKMRDVLCIPLRKLNGWLFSVNPEKVRPEIKDNLIAYQEECFEVLHDHFTKGEADHPRRQGEVPATQAEVNAYYAASTARQLTMIRQVWDDELKHLLISIRSPIYHLLSSRIPDACIVAEKASNRLLAQLPDGAIPKLY